MTNATGDSLADPDYLPPRVDGARHRIGLIGCGFISEAQLAAYSAAGLQVIALCDRTLAKAEARRNQFYPDATVTTEVEDIFRDPGIDVVDIATHVAGRPELIRRALRSGKHVLSQKPFVSDIDEGVELIELARSSDRLLAINHNGRWAPHFASALASISRGDIGHVTSADFRVYWPHDRNFEDDPHFSVMEDLILYDFGIHWFDIIAQVLADSGEAIRVFASTSQRSGQRILADTDADVIVEYETGRGTIAFRASAPLAESGSFRIEGTTGTITHDGHSLGGDSVRIQTEQAARDVELEGDWWSNGMTGTMSELLAAIDENRQPRNSAVSSLPGLALCFAALESARTGQPVDPRTVRHRHGG